MNNASQKNLSAQTLFYKKHKNQIPLTNEFFPKISNNAFILPIIKILAFMTLNQSSYHLLKDWRLDLEMSLPLYAFKTGNHDKVEIISAPSLSMSENREEDQKQFIISSYLSIIYFCFKIDRSMDAVPDLSKFPFCALIQLVLISRSSWFEERIGKFQEDLQQTLEEYDQAVVLKPVNKATFYVYHNTTCLIISDLIRNRLGFDNRVVPFSKYILLHTNESLNLLQQQMRFHKIQFRSCTRMRNNTRVEFERESQSAEGYLKCCQMGFLIQGFCNKNGQLIEEPTFSIRQNQIETYAAVDRYKYPNCSMITLINKKRPPDFQQKCREMFRHQYQHEVLIQKYNENLYAIYHDIETCFIISGAIKRKMNIDNRVIPVTNFMLLETNVKTVQKMENMMRQMNIQFRSCQLSNNRNYFQVRYDSQSRSVYAYLMLSQQGYKIQFCNEKWEVMSDLDF